MKLKSEFLQDYTGDFELSGLMIIEPVEHKTKIRCEKMDDFQSYINAIDIDYVSEDVTFTGHVYKINSPQSKVVQRSAYGKGTNYLQEIVEYHVQNCYIPISGMCFIKCIKYFTEKDYTEEFSTFTRTKKYRSGVMKSARIQPFCRKYNINLGCFDGTRINPRNITQRNTSLFIYEHHFCLTWKSKDITFNQVLRNELNQNSSCC